MREKLFRYGVVGCGGISASHILGLNEHGGELVAVCDVPDNVAALKDQHGTGDRTYGDVDAFFDAEGKLGGDQRLNLVVNCTPNHLHKKVAKGAIALGMNVDEEKPMATTEGDAVEMNEAAKDKKVFLGVAHPYRLRPLTAFSAWMIRQGILGELCYDLVRYVQDWRELFENWRDNPEVNGPWGVLGDTATHGFDLHTYLTGDPLAEVSCQLRYDLGRQTDDYSAVMGRTVGGMTSTLESTQTTNGHENLQWYQVTGKRGSLTYDSRIPGQLIWSHDGRTETLFDNPGTLIKRFPSSEAFVNQHFIGPGGHRNGDFLSAWSLYCWEVARNVQLQMAGKFDPNVPVICANGDVGVAGVRFADGCYKSHKQNGVYVALAT